ncbi:MAG: hypothetical protein ACREAB_16675 [Blastocatellia bacterium]
MRVRFLSPALISSVFAVAALAGFAQQSLAIQITFVQAPQSRNQTQKEQGLPPEKKRSLSKVGPEDVFPGANEQETNRPREPQPQLRSRPAPASRPASITKQSAAPVVTPPVMPVQPAVATPSPTIFVAALENQDRQPPLDQQSIFAQVGSKWTVPVLSGLALVVSAALVYVLTKLREKIREGSSG